jgi:ABC-type transporter Mla subunit MlaD
MPSRKAPSSTTTAKQRADLRAQLERHRADLGKTRDRLRDLLGQYNELLDAAEEAHEYLGHAIDQLSEHT